MLAILVDLEIQRRKIMKRIMIAIAMTSCAYTFHPHDVGNEYTNTDRVVAVDGVIAAAAYCDNVDTFVAGGCWIVDQNPSFHIITSERIYDPSSGRHGWLCAGNSNNVIDNTTVVVAYVSCVE
jgi:hypothetical protein